MHFNNDLTTSRILFFSQDQPAFSNYIIPYSRSTSADTLSLDGYQLFKMIVLWVNLNYTSH